MAFVGNTQHTVPYILKHSDLFCELPEKFGDSAFLNRIHCYISGWEVDIIRGEMFSGGYGFVVDYLAEILRSQIRSCSRLFHKLMNNRSHHTKDFQFHFFVEHNWLIIMICCF